MYGGRYVSETLMPALLELEKAYAAARGDQAFSRSFRYYLREYAGRETPLYFAERLTRRLGGGEGLLQTRRPLPYRGPQDQQHSGSDPFGPPNGQREGYCRDRGWAARRCHGNGGGPVWFEMRDLHGQGRSRSKGFLIARDISACMGDGTYPRPSCRLFSNWRRPTLPRGAIRPLADHFAIICGNMPEGKPPFISPRG